MMDGEKDKFRGDGTDEADEHVAEQILDWRNNLQSRECSWWWWKLGVAWIRSIDGLTSGHTPSPKPLALAIPRPNANAYCSCLARGGVSKGHPLGRHLWVREPWPFRCRYPHRHEHSDELIDLREIELWYLPAMLSRACNGLWARKPFDMYPDWAWGYVRVKALLSSRTVYEAVDNIKTRVATRLCKSINSRATPPYFITIRLPTPLHLLNAIIWCFSQNR